MTRQEHGPTPSALGPIDLARLAALQQFIGPQRPQQVLRQMGRRNRSHCWLTHEVMLWVVLARGVLTDVLET
ncbi:MAG: hypothetical protein ACRELF_23890 [Gemmataceae bacterium]